MNEMSKIKPIQRLLGDAGTVLNEYKDNDFKVNTATAQRAESLKLILLNKVRYEANYGLECGLFLNALVLATKIAKGEPLKAEFDTTCEKANTVVRTRDGVW